MEIGRHNYEQYFIDYLDGKLNQEQVRVLMTFLEFNPDLKEEFQGIEKMCLVPDEVPYEEKTHLMRSESDLAEGIILEDFDRYCIASMENDLSMEEEEKLEGIIRDDPVRKDTYRLYHAMRLLPDESILCPGKGKLKKRFVGAPYRMILPAAAAVAIMLIILQLFRGGVSESGNPSLTKQVPPNPQVEIEPRSNVSAPLVYDEKASAETTQRLPVVMDGKQPTLAEGSHSGTESFPIRDKCQMARIGSIAIQHLEGSDAIQSKAVNGNRALQQPKELEDHDPSINRSENDAGLSLWTLADAGVRGLNSVSEDEYLLDREKDKNGHIRRFTLDTPVFGISAPLRKPDKSR